MGLSRLKGSILAPALAVGVAAGSGCTHITRYGTYDGMTYRGHTTEDEQAR